MDTDLIEIGSFDVMITGVHLPLRKLPRVTQERIVAELVDRIRRNLERRFEGSFELEVLAIESGCIKARLRLMWRIGGSIAAAVIFYGEIKAGARDLWNDVGVPVIEYVAEGRTCRARFAAEHFADGLHGPVREGQTLSSIAAGLDCGAASLDQKMVALFEANPHAFIDGNLNRLRSGVALLVPTQTRMLARPSHEASALVREHSRRLRSH